MNKLNFLLIFCLLSTAMTGHALRDPTQPAAGYVTEQGQQKSLWRLSYIRSSAKQTQAMINGQFVQVGDVVGNGKVIEIKPDYVILMRNGQRHKLSLIPPSIVQRKDVSDENNKDVADRATD